MNETINQPVNEKQPQPGYYIGIGASAGGLEALETFFTHMPSNSNLAFVVIQHLSPDYKSMMVELLSKRTDMQVQRAEDGMLVLPNHVYLIPPKKNLTIFHGKLLLSDTNHARGINLPIDVFFQSLAEDQAEKAVGIILSGTGSDGVRGLRAIKENGGLVIVQDVESAKFDGMPRAAISTGLADFILPPQEIPQKLAVFAKRGFSAKTDHPQVLLSDEDGLTRIFAMLREKTGVDFTFYKPNTVVRRLDRRMTFNQTDDLRDYVRFLENNPSEINALYRELLIGVTSFMRDHEVFDEMINIYLPKLIAKNATELRVWVAGCSTGEEAYSIAITLREVMERLEKRIAIKIFATDIDRDAIIKAGNGIYPESIIADLTPKLLTKYFTYKDGQYQVDRSIREMVVFAQHNLIKDPPFTNIDLISCRNLLIYLQPVLQQKVMELFNFSLNPGGILLLGSSETVGDMLDYFEPLHQKYKIYTSKGNRRPILGDDRFPIIHQARLTNNLQQYKGAERYSTHKEDRLLERLLDSLSGEFVPLTIVVNEHLEVLHILGSTEGYFRLPSGKLVNDITKMAVRDLSIPIATGLQKLFKTEEEIRYTSVNINNPKEEKNIQLRFRLIPGKRGQEKLAAIFFEELSTKSKDKDEKEILEYDLNQEAEQRIRDLEQELQFTKENLQATIEELETSNEELQATNEELLASNEELQSTNEELQSVNEELHTVNAEYQSKIIELTELNNDLDNLISSTRIGTLFLDENLDIRKFTPEFQRVFKVLETDIGRPFHHISHNLMNINLEELVRQVGITKQEIETEVWAQSGVLYLLRIMPYQIGSGYVSGFVITLTDISLLHRTQSALTQSENRLNSLYLAAPVGVGLVVNDVWVETNQQICKILHTTRENLIGHSWEEVYPSTDQFEVATQQICRDILEKEVSTIEARWKRSDGHTFPVLITAAFLEAEDPGKGITITVQDYSNKKRVEKEAEENLSRYRFLFETLNEGVVYQDADGYIISANPAAQKILGLSIDKISGMTSFDHHWRAIRPDGSPFPGEEHPAMVALNTGKEVNNQIMGVYNPEQDTTKWIKINAVPIFENGSNKPTQVYATFLDISKEIDAGKALSQTQQKLSQSIQFSKAMLDALSVHIAILDEHGTILMVNQAWLEFAKQNDGDETKLAEGINYLSVCEQATGAEKDEAVHFADALRAVMEGKRTHFEMQYTCHSKNERRLFLGKISSYTENNQLRILVSHENISRQVQK